jgi:hypothetical protein
MARNLIFFSHSPRPFPPGITINGRMDRHKSKSRQYIDRRERLGRVNSGETFMSRLGVLPSAAIKLYRRFFLCYKIEQNIFTVYGNEA